MSSVLKKLGKIGVRGSLGSVILRPLLTTAVERLEAGEKRLVQKLERTSTPLPRVTRVGKVRRAVDPLLDNILLTYIDAIDFAADLADRLLGGEDELGELLTDIPVNLVRDLNSLQRRFVLTGKRVREAEAKARRRLK